MRIVSHRYYAEIDNKECRLTEDHRFVYYGYRWRLVQKDDAGTTFVEKPGITAFFEIKEYSLKRQRELDNLYPRR